MTPVIAPPPEMLPPTASAALVVHTEQTVVWRDELAEEPMDYTPIPRDHLAGPDFPDEVWVDDEAGGPMGF